MANIKLTNAEAVVLSNLAAGHSYVEGLGRLYALTALQSLEAKGLVQGLELTEEGRRVSPYQQPPQDTTQRPEGQWKGETNSTNDTTSEDQDNGTTE